MKLAHERFQLDESAMWIRAGADVPVADVEQHLRSRGLTLGSQPPSVLRGTVAAWLEGPYAGRRAEDGRIGPGVAAIEAVLPDGTPLRTRPAPRSAAGPAVANLLLGGGGRCGRLTAATLKATRLPPRTEELSVQGDPRRIARLLFQVTAELAPPFEVELTPGHATLGFHAGRPDLVARVTRAAGQARALGLTSGISLGRSTGDESWEREISREELERLVLLQPERLRLVRIARESAIALAAAELGKRLAEALPPSAPALDPLTERVAAALR